MVCRLARIMLRSPDAGSAERAEFPFVFSFSSRPALGPPFATAVPESWLTFFMAFSREPTSKLALAF
jgi:hypothetical protein